LKNCVKPPSPEAESDNPGDEKPFERLPISGPVAMGCGTTLGFGADVLAGGVWPLTKIRVNSPGADGAAMGAAGAGGVGFTDSVPRGEEGPGPPAVWNKRVNSPGAAEVAGPRDSNCGSIRFSSGACEGGVVCTAADAFPALLVPGEDSKPRINIAVALRFSGSSGFSFPSPTFSVDIRKPPVYIPGCARVNCELTRASTLRKVDVFFSNFASRLFVGSGSFRVQFLFDEVCS
jgi:hypothetical protein